MQINRFSFSMVFDVDSLTNAAYYKLPRDYIFPGEAHEVWEFLYVDRGSLVVTAGTDTYFLKAGELAFHCPNEFHAFQAVGEADIIVISFSCQSEAMHRLERKVLPLHTREKEHLKLLTKEAQQVYQYFENDPPRVNLKKRADAPWGGDQLIKTYLEQFLIYICRRDENIGFSQRAISTSHQAMVMAQRAQDYLSEHFNERISLASLSAALGVSVPQTKRIFREQIGQSMVRYLTALRISEAKRLIRQGHLSFTQIAEQVGYESIYYFSAIFKKQTGMTPSEYDKSLKD